MLKQIEGSQGIAEAVALCRPQVVCAYPITPQTHIVEGVGAMVRAGALTNCEFINVESEFAALSVAIGSSAVGARTYTATASQGLLFMAEAVYNAAGQPIGRGKGKAYTRDPEARSKALTTPLLPYRSFMNSDTMAQALALRQAIEQLREGVATEVVLQAMQRDQGKYPVFAPAASSLRWGLENGQLETVLRDLEMQIGSRKPPARPN